LVIVIDYQLHVPFCASDWHLFRGLLVKPEKSCMQKVADCCQELWKLCFLKFNEGLV